MPSNPMAVTPPSAMMKFLAMIESESMVSALCIMHGASAQITSEIGVDQWTYTNPRKGAKDQWLLDVRVRLGYGKKREVVGIRNAIPRAKGRLVASHNGR